jgi:hypothetical protein
MQKWEQTAANRVMLVSGASAIQILPSDALVPVRGSVMADVLFVFVKEDAAEAQTLATMFAAADHEIGNGPVDNAAIELCGAVVVLWSRAAIASKSFLTSAQRALDSGKGVVASLGQPPPAWVVGYAPTFDLSRWTGDRNDEDIDPLFMAVDYRVNSNRDDLAGGASLPGHLAGWTADLPDSPSGVIARAEHELSAPQDVMPFDEARRKKRI